MFAMIRPLKRCFSIFIKNLLQDGRILRCSVIAVPFALMACSSLMYYPRKDLIVDPAKYNLSREDVYFTNSENQKIHAWWFASKQKPAKGTWIFFHGNAENISTHFLALSWLPEAGYNYLIWDYPGYGESEGEPDPYHNVISGNAALEWVHQNKDPNPLIVYGQSMGGIVAMRTVIEMKDKIPIRIMIADGTFSSFQRIARKKLAQHWLTWLAQPLAYVTLSDRWAPDVDRISPVPLLVLHGDQDHVIEPEHGERIFADAKEPKGFIRVPDGSHGNLFWVADRKYRVPILDEMEKLAP
jgi:alpha-beta hydrolase superfamily lysophospholipase